MPTTAPGLAVLLSGVEVRTRRAVLLPTVDLHVLTGESLALMGPSGSGKTTLLDCVLGLRAPSSGVVTVLDHDYATTSDTDRSRLRRRSIGIVSQNPRLLPELSVVENVALTLVFDGVPRRRALARAAHALAEVELAGAEDLRPENLSGGEAQRAALARALVADGISLVVADEPTAALDETSVVRTVDLLLSTARTRDISVLLATHDSAVASRCDRVQRLRQHDARGLR